jgi:hypothetical protein
MQRQGFWHLPFFFLYTFWIGGCPSILYVFLSYFLFIRLYFEPCYAVRHSRNKRTCIWTKKKTINNDSNFFLCILLSFPVFVGIFFIFYFLPLLFLSSLLCTNWLVVFFLSLLLSLSSSVTKTAIASVAFFKSYLLYLPSSESNKNNNRKWIKKFIHQCEVNFRDRQCRGSYCI